jgi:hypothetical protein
LFNDFNNLLVSSDNGDSWNSVGLAYQYAPNINYDLEIDKDGTLYIGADNATISAVTPGTYTGQVHSYYQWNGSSQAVNNIQFYNGDVYYLVNSTPTPGIYRKNNNWGGPIDLGFNQTIRYYYIKNDGNFLLVADALYYKN